MNQFDKRKHKGNQPKLQGLYDVDGLQATVLLYHLFKCTDAKLDANYTQEQIGVILKQARIKLPRGMLESCLYACNRMNEEEDFWHPYGQNMDSFIGGLLPKGEIFHKYYNWIEHAKTKST